MKNYINIFKDVLNISNKKWYLVLQMFISSALYNLSSLLPPIATAGIIAEITSKNIDGIWYYVFLYIVFYIIYFSMLNWNYKVYSCTSRYYQIEVQRMLFEHVANNNNILTKMSKGKIVGTCSEDVRYLVDVIDSGCESLVKSIELIIIFFIFASYNIIVALIVAALDLFYLGLMNNNSKRVSKYYEGTRKYEDKIIDVFNQMLSNSYQVKSLNMLPSVNKSLDKVRDKWNYEYKEKRKHLTSRYCNIPYIVYVGKILLYIMLGYFVVMDKITIDRLVLLISYFELTITVTDKLLECTLNLSNYGIRVNRIKNILELSQNKNEDFGEIENDYINGTITFDKVNFEVKNKKILNNVSFKIYPNEITTIVGHSGSGKTTIINLLYRIYKVKSGSILIDNESIYNFTKDVYSKNISGVFQKPFILEMSIKDNLSLIDSNKQRQIEVCKRVGIHDYIESLPKGYNTVISNEENIFSDGQKQLLVIARALLTNAEILLFDEVTSNIDPNSTTIIAELLKELKQDHTIVMVTHKPEMMDIADRVIVLDDGKVVCKGLNDDVLKKCKLYKELKSRSFASVSKINE